MKILLNKCIGGFAFSKKFNKLYSDVYRELLTDLCKDEDGFFSYGVGVRTNWKVLTLFKYFGSEFVSGSCSDLEIVDCDNTKKFYIIETDGVEEIAYI